MPSLSDSCCQPSKLMKLSPTCAFPGLVRLSFYADPRKHGTPKYWHYTVNELGMEDCLAQIDHIHYTKCQELNIYAGPPPNGVSRPDAVVVDTSPFPSTRGYALPSSRGVIDGASPFNCRLR